MMMGGNDAGLHTYDPGCVDRSCDEYNAPGPRVFP